jgi:hypothetical protein
MNKLACRSRHNKERNQGTMANRKQLNRFEGELVPPRRFAARQGKVNKSEKAKRIDEKQQK